MMKRKDFLVTQLLCWESKVHEVPNCTGSLRLGHQSYCKIQRSWKFAFYTKNTKLSYYFKLLTFEWKFHSGNNILAFTINRAALFALNQVIIFYLISIKRQEVRNCIFLLQKKCLLDHGPQQQLLSIKKSTIGNSILSIHYVRKSIFHSDLLGFYGLEVKRSFVKLLKNVMANLVGWFFTCLWGFS